MLWCIALLRGDHDSAAATSGSGEQGVQRRSAPQLHVCEAAAAAQRLPPAATNTDAAQDATSTPSALSPPETTTSPACAGIAWNERSHHLHQIQPRP